MMVYLSVDCSLSNENTLQKSLIFFTSTRIRDRNIWNYSASSETVN